MSKDFQNLLLFLLSVSEAKIHLKIKSSPSPLIILFKCGKLELLKQLFGPVLIPEAVQQEVVNNTKNVQQSDEIYCSGFIQVNRIPEQLFQFSHRIDRDEAEAILLAASLKADYFLLDDKRAQKEARLHQVNFIPTFAVLLKATQKGFLSDQVDLAEPQKKNIFES